MLRTTVWMLLSLFVFLFATESVSEAGCRGGRRGVFAGRKHRLRNWLQNRPHRFQRSCQ